MVYYLFLSRHCAAITEKYMTFEIGTDRDGLSNLCKKSLIYKGL